MLELSLISSIVKAVSGNAAGDAMKTYDTLRQMSSGPNSLSKKAKMGIYEFPFLISSNLSNLKDICSIMKCMEVEYGNMLLVTMGINPTVNSDINYQIQRTLSNYHTNSNDYAFTVESVYQKDIEAESVNAMYKKMKGRITTEGPFFQPSNPNSTSNSSGLGHSTPSGKDLKDIAQGKDLTSMTAKEVESKYSAMFNATMIKISLRIGETKDTAFDIPIGIKGTPQVLQNADVDYILTSFLKTKKAGLLNRFLRWRSGEIKGFHNLLLRYDEIKADADFDKRVGTNNSWLKVLKSRANNRRVNLLAKVFGSLGTGKNVEVADILPNCTFVINLSDVDAIEAETGINLFTDPVSASKMLDDSMGLGLCIIDDAMNVAHLMYSGYTKYTSMPASALMSSSKKDGDMTSVLLDIMKKI